MSNRPEGYKTMGVSGEVIEHPSDLTKKVPGRLTTILQSERYGSDTGVEMAATYHSVIRTVRPHGSSVWDFIGTFFKNIFNGSKNYVNMVPDKITLAVSQC